MGLEKLLGGIIIAGAALLGCNPPPKTIDKIKQEDLYRLSHYEQGLYYKYNAEHKEGEEREALLMVACANFQKAKETDWHEAMLQLADCKSQLGQHIQAQTLIEEALLKKKTADAHNIKGLICVRAGYADKEPQLQTNYYHTAFEEFSKAIRLNDYAQVRWNRYETAMNLVVMKGLSFLDYAFEDAKKFTEFLPKLPDGYIAQYVVLNWVAGGKLATGKEKEGEEYVEKAYIALDDALRIIDSGQKPKRQIVGGTMTVDNLYDFHKAFESKYGPAEKLKQKYEKKPKREY